MAETKQKKIRIYKLASEYNLSVDSIIELLTGKGYKVKSHMTNLSDEMLSEIHDHFKKDIENAQKHYQKLAEFDKKRTDKVQEEEAAIEPTVEEVVEEQVPTEIKITDVSVESEKKKSQEPVVKEKEPGKKEKKETEEKIKPRGLKVIGKIDLDKSKPEKAEKENKIVTQTEEKKVVKKKKRKRKSKKQGENAFEDSLLTNKKKKAKRFVIDQREVKETIRKTLQSMDDISTSGRAGARKKKRQVREAIEEEILEQKVIEEKILKVNEFIAVNELANLMEVPVSDVISKCMELGIMVSINQRLDLETITLVADEFGYEVELQEEYSLDVIEDTVDDPETLEPRPPVVTIMGHVDHGKTSLLDYIRNESVVAGEFGGITQHIGAYKVDVGNGKNITFLDTPGHEAFTAMRARGAQITDIVVLIVAADDAVMPQTIEAINHSLAANVPIVIAINKIDKPDANVEKIRQQLADRNLLVEEWGGKYQCVEISAKTGKNIDQLLETILLEAEMLDLKTNPNRSSRGAVVETELDKGRGIMGTILVQKGTLKIGDPFLAGIYQGRVKAMFDERGNKVDNAPPSTPVLVVGFEGVPQAGDSFVVVESDKLAREIGIKRQRLKREQDQKQVHHITLDEIAKQISIGGVKELPLIVKGDVDGSIEALSDSFMKLSAEEVRVRVIHRGVGAITESDVLLAAASGAIIIGFNVRPNLNSRKLAEKEKVDIRLYNVIYDAIEEVKSALEGLLSPILSEEIVATLEVRNIFKVPKFGTVAGCFVQDGKISRNDKIRLIRDGI
ncbi:MAG: translation initiation factor IF-2, partial [Bacteroidetes bacterium]|nr:translation initiation factor IF-2 [Bacteroidota bacterium]